MRLIINADDFGANDAINEATVTLMHRGLVTSATTMANGNAVAAAVQMSFEFPQCSFGAHLCLTWGSPVGDPKPLGCLVDEDGGFCRNAFDVRFTWQLVRAVEREWKAQIDKLHQLGLRISHLDSHEHVHTIPALFPALKRVQRHYGLRRVRISRNIGAPDHPPYTALTRYKKLAWNTALRRIYPTATTDWFTDLYSLVRAAQAHDLAGNLVEVMVHPGATGWPTAEAEIAELENGVLQDFPVHLTSYQALQ